MVFYSLFCGRMDADVGALGIQTNDNEANGTLCAPTSLAECPIS